MWWFLSVNTTTTTTLESVVFRILLLSLSLRVCVCVDVLLFFAVVSSGNNKKALAGALVKELLLWRVIVCEKIFSVVKKRGSQRVVM